MVDDNKTVTESANGASSAESAVLTDGLGMETFDIPDFLRNQENLKREKAMSLYEQKIAEMEYERNKARDNYFEQRPQLDNDHNKRIFEAGFERAWKAKDDVNNY
jgi:hypothetical protein